METTDQVSIRGPPPHIRTLLYTLPYIFGEVLLSTDHCNRFATRPWQGHPNTLASIPLRRRGHPDRGSPPSRPPPRPSSRQTFLFPMPLLLLRCFLISCFYDRSRLSPGVSRSLRPPPCHLLF